METEYTGVFINGSIALDGPLSLPEQTRVIVKIAESQTVFAPIRQNQPEQSGTTEKKTQRVAAVRKFLDVARQTQIPLDELKFTRDELYGRD
jgi:hypothetical protein